MRITKRGAAASAAEFSSDAYYAPVPGIDGPVPGIGQKPAPDAPFEGTLAIFGSWNLELPL